MQIRSLDIKIAKYLGYKSRSDMDFGSYLTYVARGIDYCPPGHGLCGSEEEAWACDVPFWIEWLLVYVAICTVVITILGFPE